MRGEGARGTHGGDKRWRIHSLGKPWRKYHRKLGGGDRMKVTRSRGWGETAGAGERIFRIFWDGDGKCRGG